MRLPFSSAQPSTGTLLPRPQGLRAALCAVFAAHGFMYASFAVRIPALKEQVGASSAALGLALLGLSAGAVATMLLAGALWTCVT